MNDCPVKPCKLLLMTGFIFCLFFMISCSDSLPHVSNVVSTVIYEFNDYESTPEVRLSVFAQCDPDVRRIEKFKIYSEKSGYDWKCTDVELIQGKNGKAWAGYSNFVSATGEGLPEGRYSIDLEDYSGNEASGNFTVRYTKTYAAAKASDFPDIIKISKTKFYALFDENENLVYYGEKKDDWSDEKDMFSHYKAAVNYRVCYQVSNGSILIVMPSENIDKENNDSNEE